MLPAPDSFEMMVNSIPFRKSSTVQTISVFLGILVVDRFYLGDVLIGVIGIFFAWRIWNLVDSGYDFR